MSNPVTADVASQSWLRKRGLRRCMFCHVPQPRSEFTGPGGRTCSACAPMAAEQERQRQLDYKRMMREKREAVIRYVPVAPLLATLLEEAEKLRREQGGLSDSERYCVGLRKPEGTIVDRAGVSEKTLQDWTAGKRVGASLESAEKLMFALDKLWWEIWAADRWPAEHKIAARAFGDAA